MIEDENLCAICNREIGHHWSPSGVPHYFCAPCFIEWREQIDRQEPWVKYLVNAEKQRRKKRNRRLTFARTFPCFSLPSYTVSLGGVV